MKYFIDCEFDSGMGMLISLALVSEVGEEFYWARQPVEVRDAWVKKFVLPIIDAPGASPNVGGTLSAQIERYLIGSKTAHIIADWPDDVAYFCKAMITGPGYRIDTPPLTFEVLRIDAYPTDLPGAVQHNALWDARALRHAVRNAAE